MVNSFSGKPDRLSQFCEVFNNDVDRGAFQKMVTIDPAGNELERTLWYSARINHYSFYNVLWLKMQNPGVREVRSKTAWKNQFGFDRLPMVRGLSVSAPKNESRGQLSSGFRPVTVYDIRDVNSNRGWFAGFVPVAQKEVVRQLAKAMNASITVSAFNEGDMQPLKIQWSKRNVALNKKVNPDEFIFLALKGLSLLRLWGIATTNGTTLDLRSSTAQACAIGFEVACYIGNVPPHLPEEAKRILCMDVNGLVYDSHEVAKQTIRDIETLSKTFIRREDVVYKGNPRISA